MTQLPNSIMAGKVCMVTGAASGIGGAAAVGLARLGAHVVMVDCDIERAEQARSAIAHLCGPDHVEFLVADLSSQKAVRHLAEEYRQNHGKLHVLVNNAGVLLARRSVTEDGVETTLAVNHLARFLLVHLLMDTLKAGAPARIVNVCSQLSGRSRMRLEDLQLERRYSAVRAYSQSMLANIMCTYELARRLEGTGVTANCFHPGMVRTRLFKHAPFVHRLLFTMFSPLFQSPAQGAKALIRLASSPELLETTGRFFAQEEEARSHESTYDEDLASQVWHASVRLTRQIPEGSDPQNSAT